MDATSSVFKKTQKDVENIMGEDNAIDNVSIKTALSVRIVCRAVPASSFSPCFLVPS